MMPDMETEAFMDTMVNMMREAGRRTRMKEMQETLREIGKRLVDIDYEEMTPAERQICLILQSAGVLVKTDKVCALTE